MKVIRVSLTGLGVILSLYLLYDRGYSEVSEKKVIKLFGWDKVTTSFLKEHSSEIEKVPLDGLCVVVMPDKGIEDSLLGDQGNYFWFGSFPFSRSDFAKATEDLKAARIAGYSDNFMHMTVNGPRGADWFDDGWKTVVENARVAAWVCKEGGLKGTTLDVENGPYFNYAKLSDKHSFEEYAVQARKCGKEWMEAIASVYPDITVILTHGYWVAADEIESLGVSLKDTNYGLLPAFIDRLL